MASIFDQYGTDANTVSVLPDSDLLVEALLHQSINKRMKSLRNLINEMLDGTKAVLKKRLLDHDFMMKAAEHLHGWYSQLDSPAENARISIEYCIHQIIFDPIYHHIIVSLLNIDANLFSENKMLTIEHVVHLEQEAEALVKYCCEEFREAFDPVFNKGEVKGRRGDAADASRFWEEVEAKPPMLLQKDGIVWSLVAMKVHIDQKYAVDNFLRHIKQYPEEQYKFRPFKVDALLQLVEIASVFLDVVSLYRDKTAGYFLNQCTQADCGLHGMLNRFDDLEKIYDDELEARIWGATDLARSDTAIQALNGLTAYLEHSKVDNCATRATREFLQRLAASQTAEIALEHIGDSDGDDKFEKTTSELDFMENSAEHEPAEHKVCEGYEDEVKEHSTDADLFGEPEEDKENLVPDPKSSVQISRTAEKGSPSQRRWSSAKEVKTPPPKQVTAKPRTPAEPASSRYDDAAGSPLAHRPASKVRPSGVRLVGGEGGRARDMRKGLISLSRDEKQQPRQQWAFTDEDHYDVWKVIIPGRRSEQARKRVKLNHFVDAMCSPPFSFDLKNDGVFLVFRRKDGRGQQHTIVLHAPHGNWVEEHVLVNYRRNLRRMLSLEPEDFVLRKK
ncbi:hypothetical protein PMZ80_010314 [Knufia obscura]|uniref:Uncharacterized protein n=2 Tax=Knufia TaxID=430999 RepID=A0AAN8F5J8_9EURO|nr:hypothetical protein PMZ80_010314 [Knufia obscura]KAK5951821.1 hypothetical protein OHC33_007113 [Knufia fluminis]